MKRYTIEYYVKKNTKPTKWKTYTEQERDIFKKRIIKYLMYTSMTYPFLVYKKDDMSYYIDLDILFGINICRYNIISEYRTDNRIRKYNGTYDYMNKKIRFEKENDAKDCIDGYKKLFYHKVILPITLYSGL